ncbi:MAG: alpha/beta hydrolase [Paracoccaceae bacterium]
MTAAPFHAELAQAPPGGELLWRTTSDGVRLRVGIWKPPEAKGTILLLPGRTEFIEKYGRVISTLVDAEFAVSIIDWRGQGYSDRLTDDIALGHVGSFSDYQIDLKAMVDATQEAGFPQPWHVVSHSMGGNIALRALIDGLDVKSTVFSAPMWGIHIPVSKRLAASVLPTLARVSGKELEYLPGTSQTSYLLENGFENNLLTSDNDHFVYLSELSQTAPELALGGPSIHWFAQAQAECSALFQAPRPDVPVHTFYGTEEGIVEPNAIRKMHENWPSSTLTVISDARHELMMEAPLPRQTFLDKALEFLDAG